MRVYPQYAFASHKGYATREHRRASRRARPVSACIGAASRPVLNLLERLAGAEEWDAELEWVPDVDDGS